MKSQGKPGSRKKLFHQQPSLKTKKKARLEDGETGAISRALLEASTDAVLLLRTDGTIMDLNERMSRSLGGKRRNLIGTRISAHIDPTLLDERFRKGIAGALKGQAARFEDQRHGRWLENSVFPVFDEHGNPILYAIYSRDITERKLTEDALRRSELQLHLLTARIEETRENEQKRISREIHDDLGQALTALKIDLGWIEKKVAPEQTKVIERLKAAKDLTDQLITSVQRISNELRIGILDDLGLSATIEWYSGEFQSRTGIQCRVIESVETDMIANGIASACFRILQESLTNIARHAGATQIDVRLALENKYLVLEIRDNGKGIADTDLANNRSLGILGMKERAWAIGAALFIKGSPQSGTTVRLVVPQPDRVKQ